MVVATAAMAVATIAGLLLVLFGWLRDEIRQVRTDLGADMQRLEDRIGARLDRMDGRLVRIEEQVSGLDRRVARIEGHLGVAGSTPPTKKD